jgi:hypothetical protein
VKLVEDCGYSGDANLARWKNPGASSSRRASAVITQAKSLHPVLRIGCMDFSVRDAAHGFLPLSDLVCAAPLKCRAGAAPGCSSFAIYRRKKVDGLPGSEGVFYCAVSGWPIVFISSGEPKKRANYSSGS